MFLNKKINLRTRGLVQESMNTNQVGGMVRLVRKVIKGTILIELTGAALLSIRFVPEFGLAKGLCFGLFHSVSAFCNAGFDLMGEAEGIQLFTTFSDDILVNVVIMSLIVVGGIGFLVWDDVTKHRFQVKKYMLHTKIVLFTTFVLIFGGALFFLHL